MTIETATKLSDENKMNFVHLDADTLRKSLIRRYAHILYGDITRSKLTAAVSIGQRVAGITFISTAEQAHLQQCIKSDIEDHQNRRECDRWAPRYSIDEVILVPVSDHLEIQVTATVV
ncbi:MAG: hypothetical protein JWO55_523 [Candidatus Saccharibacteria bacterium]|nr:hypothetical protein [Candidatus Saccharibacteria bacterium]